MIPPPQHPTLRVLVLLVALVPAACATDHSPEAFCRRQAENDPKIQSLEFSSGRNTSFAETHAGELVYLRRQDTLRCLQARGLVPGGGVEPVQPPIP
ncbi:MAG: hypothetical protein ACREFU_05965 [Acetobacteraceae bacterium]